MVDVTSSNPHVIAAQRELERKGGEPVEGYIQPDDLAAAYEHLEDAWKYEIEEQRLALPHGVDGDVLTTNAAGQAEWRPPAEVEPELPDGGNDSDVLTLTEQPDGSLIPEWQPLPDDERGCYATYRAWEEALDSGDCGSPGSPGSDLQPLLDRIAALEDMHANGTIADHVPTYGRTP